jgi:RES domain-containing protein
MLVYRIAGRKYSKDISGTGASLYGGRWNKKGTPVLYTSENEALALLEFIVNTPPLIIPDPDLLVLEIPENSVTEITQKALPRNWDNYPAPAILAEIGQRWVAKNETIALRVPSCIIHNNSNYILNCQHPEYKTVRVVVHKQFKYDPRFKK